ncbi:MAG: VCBS repeat-containing protein, partial [Flavobacteriales bacterium]|nr:VCBS repeat-containing protein [Flavobacteriales bacterium]
MRYISSLCFALLFPLLGFSQFMESYTMTKTDKAGGAGSYHRKYYYVDFDLDGTMDVVSNAQPSYYKGLGDGHFERIPLNLTGGNTIELAPMIVCDFDGDGDIDLYVDNDLFLNDGALNLQFYQGNYTEDPETVFAVDLFGDSKLEMLSAEGSSSSNNLVLYHSTDQLLDHDTVLVNGMFDVDRYEMLDLDDDDDLDILCWVDDDFGHLMNLGDGQFGPLTSMNNGQAVTGDILRFDFDNDGLKDMVWRRSNAVGWLRNLGAGNYANSATITTAFTASGSGNNYHAHNCDCDEDGLEEIYFDGGQGNMYKLSQDGVGGFVLNQIFTTGLDDFWKWYFEDMDMDGDIDILIFTDFNFLICHNEAGSFSNPMNLNNNLPGLSLSNDVPDRLIDLTGDGFLDIPIWVDHAFNSPTINEHTRAIVPGPLYNKAFALTAQTMNYGFYGAHFLDFDFGDLDGDGTCEMVVAGQRELAYVLHPDSSGNYNFSHRQMLPDVESLSTRNVRFADMNGDGRLDIVSRHPSPIDNYAPKTLGIMFQNEDGSFEKEYMGPTYSNYFASSVFHLVDIDLDGDIDICYQNKIRLNNGDGTFGTMQNLNTGISNSDTDFTAMGDFNGDGLLDLVYTKKNPNANNIKYFINQGNAVFDTGVNLVLPESTTGPE